MTNAEKKVRIMKQNNDSTDFQDIALKLDDIAKRAAQTGQRLERIEQMRQQNLASNNELEQSNSYKFIFDNDSYRPARPQQTNYHVKRRRTKTQSRDVTLEQIFEALSCLREEINMLNENHDELVQQVNVIKSLIE